jgi:hypothetical protein
MRAIKSTVAFVLTLIWMISVIGFAAGCDYRTLSEPSTTTQDKPPVPASPFLLAVATDRAGITMAHSTHHDRELPRRDFHVVLSNVSGQPQTVWEDWNSWGYQAISFELTTADKRNYVLSKRQQAFTVNFPSTLVIEPGEHEVYVIHLDEWWETHTSLPKTAELPITLKAIYEVSPTPESGQYKVWTGRIESHLYNFTLRQW